MEYELIRGSQVLEAGRGTTIEISSGHIVFVPENQISAGLSINATVDFPSHDDGLVPKLRIWGETVDVERGRVAVRILGYEFFMEKLNRAPDEWGDVDVAPNEAA
jgi:hypothetical protein